MKVTKKQVINKLTSVLDPELNISIVDMGLIYDVKISKNQGVEVIMTLTTTGCPLYDIIHHAVEQSVKSLGVKEVKVTLVFDPPWSIDKMSSKAKQYLGIK